MTAQLAFMAETDGVRVEVRPVFLDEESDPARGRYVWAYHILIENRRTSEIEVLSRYWRITDAAGRQQEVAGEGVVGQQPIIPPGQSFRYSSGVPLSEPSGVMQGVYSCLTEDGDRLNVRIPLFPLDSPYDRRRAN
jgi:ApaG protein